MPHRASQLSPAPHVEAGGLGYCLSEPPVLRSSHDPNDAFAVLRGDEHVGVNDNPGHAVTVDVPGEPPWLVWTILGPCGE